MKCLMWFLIGCLWAWPAFELGFGKGMKWVEDLRDNKRPPVGARLWW